MTSKTEHDQVKISVIIPVYNDICNLKLCLDALSVQDYPEAFEALVIDNGSDDADKVKQLTNNYSFANYYEEHRKGSYTSRNKGITNSKGDTLAFTDSDCIPASNWLSQGLSSLDNNYQLVGGKISIYFREHKNPTSVELYDSLFAFPQDRNIQRGESVTANLFVKREVFKQIGNFNEDTLSGGDFEFTRRATSSGYSMVYGESVVVNHPARRTFVEYRKKLRRTIGGTYLLRNQHPAMAKEYELINLIKGFIPPISEISDTVKARKSKQVTMIQSIRIIAVCMHNKYFRAFYRLGLKFHLCKNFQR